MQTLLKNLETKLSSCNLEKQEMAEVENLLLKIQKETAKIDFKLTSLLDRNRSTKNLMEQIIKELDEKKCHIENINQRLQESQEELKQTNEELTCSNNNLSEANDLILEKNTIIKQSHKNIVDSINYAKRIQSAILPEERKINEYFPQHFILYRPKDIVSGDFFWTKKINGIPFLASADCTGHGVPGALVSMLGISLMNEIAGNGIDRTDQFLEELRNKIKQTLKQHNCELKDSIDISLIKYDKHEETVEFSGAYSSIYIIRDSELSEYKGNKQPIGIHINETPFTSTHFEIKAGDNLYLFTDGFSDQIGGIKKKKYLTKNFKQLLARLSSKPIDEQKVLLEEEFDNWKEQNEQIDDVLVIGIKF